MEEIREKQEANEPLTAHERGKLGGFSRGAGDEPNQ